MHDNVHVCMSDPNPLFTHFVYAMAMHPLARLIADSDGFHKPLHPLRTV